MDNKGCDLPVWLLWLNIDYTMVGQLSGATKPEQDPVLWCSLGVLFALIPVLALPSPLPSNISAVHISTLDQVSPKSRLPDSDFYGTSEQAPGILWFSRCRLLWGTSWPSPWTTQQDPSSYFPHSHCHACHRTRRAHLSEGARLTSFAEKQDLLASFKGFEPGVGP